MPLKLREKVQTLLRRQLACGPHRMVTVFAKLKTLLRKAEARSVEATWKSIGSLLEAFSPAECANYLTNSGYASC